MRLLSVRPGGLTHCDLGSGYWSLVMDTTTVRERACLGLKLRTLPAVPLQIAPNGQSFDLHPFAGVIIAASAVEVASSTADLEPIARVVLEDGTQEANVRRLTEAMSMFKNNTRVRVETLNLDITAAAQLIAAYWRITDWLLNPQRERVEFTAADARLVLEP